MTQEDRGTARERAVLCVDDDRTQLEILERALGERFTVVTRDRPLAALELLEKGDREFVTIVSDMEMPLMDGAAFFSYAAKLVPKSTRVLLTGRSELDTAIAAVNTGQIFRFLRKPCAPRDVLAAVEAAAEQHRLLTLEERLLAETLTGGVRLLCEVFSLIAPRVFGQNDNLQAYVLYLAGKLGRKDAWRFELAACLNLVGYVGLPDETLTRALSGAVLSETEARLVAENPLTAHRLLEKIPHFGDVAEMIRRQSAAIQGAEPAADIALGAAMLRVSGAVARLVSSGATEADAVAQLRPSADAQDLELLVLLEEFRAAPMGEVRALRVAEMTAAMILEEDARTKTGVVVVPAGKQLTSAMLERLLRFARAGVLLEPIRVRMPA
jgi:response regulator RpfG family c-di-GMP phosphodiesterase